jgi:hypothetical protein
MNKEELPLKIYPSRTRSFIGFIIGILLSSLLFLYIDRIPEETPWFMYIVLYGLPILALIGGLKNTLFPVPQIIIYKEGLSYPKIGLKMLPWKDILNTHLQQKVIKTTRHTYFAPTESDRCLEITIAEDSEAFQQIKPLWRIMLKGHVLPIALMGSKTTTSELQEMIKKAQEENSLKTGLL